MTPVFSGFSDIYFAKHQYYIFISIPDNVIIRNKKVLELIINKKYCFVGGREVEVGERGGG